MSTQQGPVPAGSANADGSQEPAPQEAQFPNVDPSSSFERRLEMVLDVPITLSLELGRAKLSVRELLDLTQGSVVKLDRPAGEPLDILVNGCLVARGEVVVVNERFGVRVTDVVSPEERVRRAK